MDSLYLSYPGKLFYHQDETLQALKDAARSGVPGEVANAQLRLGDHIFEVRDKGTGLFAYVLEDNAYRISLASVEARALPMAYVKVSSHCLASASVESIEGDVRDILSDLGKIEGVARVSRIDLFVDFVSDIAMESWAREAWVTRARSINTYAVGDRFSGWAIGLGGPMAARLYDKTLEILKSRKDWLRALWLACGWDGRSRVLRLEFEIKRDVLKELGLESLADVMRARPGLWSYATTEWLRLTLPNPEDATRSRWPIHPLWGWLSSVDWDGEPGPVSRSFTPERAPRLEWVRRQALSAMCSLMALRGIYDDVQGLALLQREVNTYIGDRSERQMVTPSKLVHDQVALKARRFNTAYNLDEIPGEDGMREEHDELLRQAAEYRKASRGG